MNPRRHSGFTLIELSIVLVIIGLIIGGVMVGKDLIKAAEIRSMIVELESYKTSINAFRLKYNAYPGDMSNATEIWGTAPSCKWGETTDGTTCNGNGDGIIGATTNAENMNGDYTVEYTRFWQHLSNSKLIPGNYTGSSADYSNYYGAAEPGINMPVLKNNACVSAFRWPSSPYPVYTSFYPGDYKFIFYVGLPLAGDVCYSPAFTPTEVFSIDTKIDDGLPGTGNLRPLTPNWASTADCATTLDPSTARYKTSSSSINCNILFIRIAP